MEHVGLQNLLAKRRRGRTDTNKQEQYVKPR